MFDGQIVKVIIPALNEEASVPLVLGAVPRWVDQVIVVDNGSTDATATAAARGGATVVHCPRRGYGRACLAGMANLGHCDIVVFMDADFSDHPEQMDRLVEPIAAGTADMVIGSRTLGASQSGSLTLVQRWGNALACLLIRMIWRGRFSDLGPFRALRASSLRALRMRDPTYGWTVEMQIKALRDRLRVVERPVSYRKRVGKSKISGTVAGVVGASAKILTTIAGHAMLPGAPPAHRQRLIVFTRYPMPGKSKTRLLPALGPLGAADLQRRMTQRVISGTAPVHGDYETHVSYTGCDGRTVRRWLGPHVRYTPQGRGDLGDRMGRALLLAFADGRHRAVIIGTDCPTVSAEHVAEAFESLRTHDVVLGPCADGGYWLIGARRAVDIFDGVRWGSGAVLDQTRELAARAHLSVHELAEMPDIDRPEDLALLPEELTPAGVVISVIIPTLNEAAFVAAAVASAHGGDRTGVEVIVADGGSDDVTVDLARRAGARVVCGPHGRSPQMNLGASVAQGEILLFLHADTVLPESYTSLIFDALSDPGVVGGAFLLGTDLKTAPMALVEKVVEIRSRCLHLPYGDQAIFVRRRVFEQLGGFPQLPFAEDLAFVRILGRTGRLVILPAAVTTSARKWRRLGIIRTTLANQVALARYALGAADRFPDGFNR